MENNLVCKWVKVFSEIAFHNQRLSELGKEAVAVLDDIIKEGVPSDALATMMAAARRAERAGMEECRSDIRRCKWWNKGYCRERQSCSYSHPAGDCQDHLMGGCTNRRCSTLRHRKVCKYFPTEGGCLWGEKCAYLHPEKYQTDNEVQNVRDLPDTDRQTEVDGLGDNTDDNKDLDSAQKEGRYVALDKKSKKRTKKRTQKRKITQKRTQQRKKILKKGKCHSKKC